MNEFSATEFRENIQQMVWSFYRCVEIDALDSSAPPKMILHSTAGNRKVDILHWVQQFRRHSLEAAAFSNIFRRSFRWWWLCVQSLLWFRCTNGHACIGDAFLHDSQYIVIRDQTFPVQTLNVKTSRFVIVILWLHTWLMRIVLRLLWLISLTQRRN